MIRAVAVESALPAVAKRKEGRSFSALLIYFLGQEHGIMSLQTITLP